MGVSEHGLRHLGHLHLVLRRRHLLHRRDDGGQRGWSRLFEAGEVTKYSQEKEVDIGSRCFRLHDLKSTIF